MFRLRYIGSKERFYVTRDENGRAVKRVCRPGDEINSVYNWKPSRGFELATEVQPEELPVSPSTGELPDWTTLRAMRFKEARELLGSKSRTWTELQAEHWRLANGND